ncbi:MAG TPA: methyl-accepting chemotaxis protein [Myxococcaceae bacterium]|nr:methyl-accepting chemotaxis protein [Myxococcaceae bacterium]
MSTLRDRVRSLLPYGASVLVALALYVLVTIPADRAAHRGFEARANSVANVLAHGLGSAAQFEDAKTVEQDLGAAAAAEPSLHYAVVRTAERKLVGGYKPELADKDPSLLDAEPRSREEGDLLHLSVPMAVGKEHAGWLQAGFDLQELYRAELFTHVSAALMAVVALILSASLFSRSAAARRRMLEQIAATSSRLRATSVQMVSASSQQASAAAEHAAAVEETRRTMQSLVDSAARIATTSREVQSHADQSVQGAQAVSHAIRTFASQAEKIGDISELIRSIADKSDLLALNASLEGTKAGEAGRGFSLVANEMRRLSESVLGAAREIKQLSSGIRGASETAEASVLELRTASERTSGSVRDISRITDMQREATEQVTKSMNELGHVLAETGATIRRTEESAGALLSLADSLAQLTAQVVRRPGQDKPSGGREASA